MTSSTVQEPKLGLGCPPCLRRLAPAVAIIQDDKGRRPKVSSGGALLVANHKYQIRVIASVGDAHDRLVNVSLAPDEYIRPLGPAQEHLLGDGRNEYVLHFTMTGLVRPYPAQARICIVLNHSRWGNYPKVLPVVIWPSMLNRVLWSTTTVVGTIWPSHIAQIAIADGHIRTLPEIVNRLRDSQELLLITAAAVVCVGMLVYVANWGYQLLFVTSDGG
jgi:hypothetical protein